MSGRPRRLGLALALLSGGLGGLWGCYQPSLPKAEPIVPMGDVATRGLGPVDPMEQAKQVITNTLTRRERRMREAWEPGSQWATLRIEQRDIDAGRITLAQLLAVGQELFMVDFTAAQGLGNGLAAKNSPLAGPRPAPNLRHVQYKQFGGPDSTRCLACHHLGGPGGGGFRIDNALLDGDGEHPVSTLERNPRALWGAAVVQQLAAEMSSELKQSFRTAQRELRPGTSTPLVAKGVQFGILRKSKLGVLETSGVRGVRQDLLIRPFGWKGTVVSLRQIVIEQLQRHLGIQAEELVATVGMPGAAPLGDGPPGDPDNDGVTREATTGMVTALTAYLAALTLPIEESPEPPTFLLATARGGELFTTLGCASCHVPELPLDNPIVSLGPTPRSRPRVDLTPLLKSSGRAERPPTVRLYSDLKMHDMGEGLSETRGYQGVPRHLWLTPPLWGVGVSAPYLHDGSAGSVHLAILQHGGEATAARDAYAALPVEDGGRCACSCRRSAARPAWSSSHDPKLEFSCARRAAAGRRQPAGCRRRSARLQVAPARRRLHRPQSGAREAADAKRDRRS